MQRQLEPELMEDPEQVKAYADADFEVPHNQFIERLQLFINNPEVNGVALDLGCGPGDITYRFAKAFPLCKVHAVDGSKTMLARARFELSAEFTQRINFIHGLLPDVILPKPGYEIIFSNSLLHHLPDPQALWQTIKKYVKPGGHIVIMDLLRPENEEIALAMVKTYAANEPEILQRDFYHSLLAAFTLEEINQQLSNCVLQLNIEQISDRHVFISGVG